ncbi:MAG: hypothetical protein COA44_12245 [Arcobacter sp.]|nr:MAG: hypothetical protein COA44_12245 [Arcobacter sp.]
MKLFGLLLTALLFLTSCSSPSHDHTLTISTTTWIGYTPLFYAKEKGWLKTEDIKLINVVSLSENLYLYKAGNSDAYCGTQYEHSVLKTQIPSLVPIILFDRSNGGDIIMSNHSIKQLQESNDKIDTYLEMDSINFTLLNDFIQNYKIDESRINYLNRDQTEIATLHNDQPNRKVLIITYIPYDTKLTENGFREILSTKNGLDLLVIDALFTRHEELILHKKQFIALKDFNNKAIDALNKNPKEFFDIIEPYMDGLSYEEFKHSLTDIEWINKDLSPELKERMRKASFPTKDLL